jgi:hypothetical protein
LMPLTDNVKLTPSCKCFISKGCSISSTFVYSTVDSLKNGISEPKVGKDCLNHETKYVQNSKKCNND